MTRFRVAVMLWLVFLCGTAFACSLPAEPSAAVVPDTSDPDYAKIKYVEEGGSFYFLLPENTNVKLRIVWDPYDHNGGNLQDKYDWVARSDKGNVPGDPYAPVTLGRKYFPLSAMAAFFQVSGNRNSIVEAFNRSVGSPPNNTFQSDSGMGPSFMLRNSFVKPGQGGKITIFNDQRAPGYPDASLLCSPSGDEVDVDELDSTLPNDGSAFTSKTSAAVEFSRNGKDYQRMVEYSIGKAGLYLSELSIALTTLHNEDYKAYIVAGEPNVWQEDTIPIIPENSEGGVGNSTGEIEMTFHTPNVGAAAPTKLKVNCPAAGFEVTNLFWCWEEKVTTKVASDTDNDGDTDSFVDDPADPVCTNAQPIKCSVGLKIVITKPAASNGYTAFKVYATQPPIASKLTLTEPDKVYKVAENGVTVPFSMDVYGSDPFADKPVSGMTGKDGTVIKHNVDEMKSSVKFFMSYPVYDFKSTGGLGVSDFYDVAKVNLGLMDFDSRTTPTWKGSYYEPKWVWRKADSVSITSANFQKLTADGSTLWGGGKWTIAGNAVFNVPGPQHFSTEGGGKSLGYEAHGAEYPAADKPDAEKLWKVCAVAADTSGHNCMYYSDMVSGADGTTARPSAGMELEDGVVVPADPGTVMKIAYDQEPPLATKIPSDIPHSGSEYTWQKYQTLKCNDDNTPPEIQVIVFDTRNNRYHIFGTKAGGDDKLSSPDYAAYQAANPYSTTDNGAITGGLSFTNYDQTLYDKFLNDPAGGLSTVGGSCPAGSGFVCQANTRLIFYIRAWDNMNTFNGAKTFGVQEVTYSVADFFATGADTPPSGGGTYDPVDLMQNPPVWQFRAPNVNGGSPESGKDCSLTVTAKDFNGATRTLTLKVFVLAHDLTIRSLEEKRNRN
ncbi:MAG: hypothetical protein GX442_03235 [Candidatus Riflebacteria bacterium]|nr:hypothetical protein [Candidatus Riflebacteria bacterium]